MFVRCTFYFGIHLYILYICGKSLTQSFQQTINALKCCSQEFERLYNFNSKKRIFATEISLGNVHKLFALVLNLPSKEDYLLLKNIVVCFD